MTDAPATDDRAALPSTLTGRQLVILTAVLFGATVIAMLVCTLFGQVELTSWEAYRTIAPFRLQRLIVAALVGAALAAGGMTLQAMLRNPLAEPYLLGISSGAGVGVLLGMAMVSWGMLPAWLAWLGQNGMAFIGASITCLAVYFIAQRRGRIDGYSLILAGVIVNAFNSAVMLAINLYVEPYQIVDFSRWVMGEVREDTKTMERLVAAVCVFGGWGLLFLRGAWFNALGLGDEVAQSSGVRVARLRLETFAMVALMAAVSVALAGPIGFLGLIVPHIVRMLLPADHRLLILASGFFGAIFLMVVNTICYALAPYVQVAALPAGIVTALMGGPFFLILLRRRMAAG